ncbi:MAG: hypothetical protein IPQ25_17080 [Chitinophagaceae bacterium]|nr:hypothetical protein [Chitinophagaceae bacterium]
MTIRLRFSFAAEFDGEETAKAYGVALAWALRRAAADALAVSESPEPALTRGKVDVAAIAAPHFNA